MSLDDLLATLGRHVMGLGTIPFLTTQGDTGHRITQNAWNALTTHYRTQHPEYTDKDYYELFLRELLPLVDVAELAADNQMLLQSDYDFHLTSDQHPHRIAYVPNQDGGITIITTNDQPEVPP